VASNVSGSAVTTAAGVGRRLWTIDPDDSAVADLSRCGTTPLRVGREATSAGVFVTSWSTWSVTLARDRFDDAILEVPAATRGAGVEAVWWSEILCTNDFGPVLRGVGAAFARKPRSAFRSAVPGSDGSVADEPEETEESGSAQATPPPAKTAAPTPSATASPPTRPTNLDGFTDFPPLGAFLMRELYRIQDGEGHIRHGETADGGHPRRSVAFLRMVW
jgi:hypothetical protein